MDLAGLAAVTNRIRLATLATVVGFRNPAHLAKIVASVDVISRGRLTLGFGAGFFEDEYRQYGWELPPRPASRIRQMEEAVELILKLWTEPRTTFHGRTFRAEDAILEPKPVQKPHPPIMIAGGEQMTLRVGRWTGIAIPTLPQPTVAEPCRRPTLVVPVQSFPLHFPDKW